MESVFQGYNSCVFAYGQTGSGKTHTMVGGLADDHAICPASGLIPRIFDKLITDMHERSRPLRDGCMRNFECHVSMLEIYNESIMDLLHPEHCNLAVREDVQNGIRVESLSQKRVQSGALFADVLPVCGIPSGSHPCTFTYCCIFVMQSLHISRTCMAACNLWCADAIMRAVQSRMCFSCSSRAPAIGTSARHA